MHRRLLKAACGQYITTLGDMSSAVACVAPLCRAVAPRRKALPLRGVAKLGCAMRDPCRATPGYAIAGLCRALPLRRCASLCPSWAPLCHAVALLRSVMLGFAMPLLSAARPSPTLPWLRSASPHSARPSLGSVVRYPAFAALRNAPPRLRIAVLRLCFAPHGRDQRGIAVAQPCPTPP
ncbi:MAG: hypothetical protein KAJ19_19720 [Gammaproteobacteria bacterium]|nr:hypothetical protein [Gammaproteobacteria bacterium]